MKILFLFHPYVNAGMTRAFCEVAEPVFCSTDKLPEGARRLDWREFLSLRRRIRAREFDLIILYACQEGLWRHDCGFLHNVFHIARKLFARFPRFAPRFLLPVIKASGTRLVIYDYDDLTIIPRMRWPYLEACQLYFKLHPAINLHKSFLFQTRRDGNLWNVLRNERYSRWVKKIRPISYGCASHEEGPALEKKYDVFFAGALRYSPVRQEGRRVLEELREQGLRICLPEKVPHEEFLRLCAESWLVLSPEGAEWDSARHYESLLMRSVPLIKYPTVMRHCPLLDGVHALFYPPEPGLLAGVIRQALEDKPRLQKIAEAGRDHVVRHHLHHRLVEHIASTATSRQPNQL
jgi:hypothetical protein